MVIFYFKIHTHTHKTKDLTSNKKRINNNNNNKFFFNHKPRKISVGRGQKLQIFLETEYMI